MNEQPRTNGFAGLDDTVHTGTGSRSFGAATEQPVLPPDGKWPDAVFCQIESYPVWVRGLKCSDGLFCLPY